jgi:ribosomal protein L7Ae-like RNA K-turn-binding protein
MSAAHAENFRINKGVGALQLKTDADIDITAIRIGKHRVATKKRERLSQLKQAILSHQLAPVLEAEGVSTVAIIVSDNISHQPTSDPDDWVLVEKILKELARLQAKGKDQPPEKKYKYKKFIVGLREVQRSLNRDELRGVVIATDLVAGVEELDGVIEKIESDCVSKGVPVVHALKRRKLGKCLNKSIKQAVVGIVSLEGVHQDWKKLLNLIGKLPEE